VRYGVEIRVECVELRGTPDDDRRAYALVGRHGYPCLSKRFDIEYARLRSVYGLAVADSIQHMMVRSRIVYLAEYSDGT
jgi:hypothetical protein